MRNALFAVVIMLSSIAFALSPFLTSGFAGFSADQFPFPQVDPPVQPAGYAFSIWGVIYLWLIAGAVFGLFQAHDDTEWQAMRPPLAISLIVGCLWIAAAVASPVLATVMILVMAATSILAMLWAGTDQMLWRQGPVALYAGWLTAASGVSVGVVLGGYGVLTPETAAIVCLVAVLIVAFLVQSANPKAWVYVVAIIWALIGVILANLDKMNLVVLGLAGIGIALLGGRALESVFGEIS